MPFNKLTPTEISGVVEKIRNKYDEYIGKYYKPKLLKLAFEERYIRALRSGHDISSFLLAEISAIEELIKRAEERANAAPSQESSQKTSGFADKVIEENRRRIEKYPDIPFHPDAGEEVRRLLGALDALGKEYWPELNMLLRDTAYYMTSPEMLKLDSQLRYLASRDRGEVPQFLIRLATQLNKFPRNYVVIEREEKDYILETAFFLNDVFSLLDRVKRDYQDLSAEVKDGLNGILLYIWQLISDFRLKDFKRKKK